ncbi:hypothetical protein G6F38_012419 [Rhizopus arrhizus]|nr:hypothetical protein G6F38_012419 [Rhizopus arrhizus]
MDDEYDYFFKLLLIGDSEVGKSNVMSRFKRINYDWSRGYDVVYYTMRTIEIDNRIIKAEIWDASGQEKCRDIISSYYRDAAGIFIVYDITSRSSFENAQSWIREIKGHTNPNAVVMLVGNKVDLSKSSREIETEEGRSLAEEEGFLFIETSAKDATNIDTAFTTLIGKLCSNLPEKPKDTPTNLPEKPQATPSQSITKKCMQSRFPRVRGLFSRKEITEKEKEIFLDPFR